MNPDELTKISIELRRDLNKVFEDFWKNNSEIKHSDVFFINSVTASSIIAGIVYFMFKKDIGNFKPQFKYIDQVCQFTKDQLKSGHLMALMGKETEQ